MIHLVAHWFSDPTHAALVVSEILALLPIKYSGIVQGVIEAVKK